MFLLEGLGEELFFAACLPWGPLSVMASHWPVLPASHVLRLWPCCLPLIRTHVITLGPPESSRMLSHTKTLHLIIAAKSLLPCRRTFTVLATGAVILSAPGFCSVVNVKIWFIVSHRCACTGVPTRYELSTERCMVRHRHPPLTCVSDPCADRTRLWSGFCFCRLSFLDVLPSSLLFLSDDTYSSLHFKIPLPHE